MLVNFPKKTCLAFETFPQTRINAVVGPKQCQLTALPGGLAILIPSSFKLLI